MYIRLVVTYCNSENKLLPKEAHIDNQSNFRDNHIILNNCMDILNKKIDGIKRMIPVHLKNKDFDIVIHGMYLIGYDWVAQYNTWNNGEPIFNVQQLGVPEENKPIIQTT